MKEKIKFPKQTIGYIALLLILFLIVIVGLSELGTHKAQPVEVTKLPTFNPSLTLLAPVTGDEITPEPGTTSEEGATDTPEITATATVTETPVPPSALTESATPTDTLTPEISETPTFDGTQTITSTMTETGTPTMTATPTITGTVTETPTQGPDEIVWNIESIVQVPNQEVSQAGGIAPAANEIETEINNEISDNQVEADVKYESVASTTTKFSITVSGEDGLDQFRETIFGDLSDQIDLMGGAVTLDVSGDVIAGQAFPLLLETNPSTGFIWKVISYDSNLLRIVDDSAFDQKYTLVGSSSVQTIRFSGISDGTTTISLFYGRPWLSQEPTSRITVDAGNNLTSDSLDLSAPVDPELASESLSTGLEVVDPTTLTEGTLTTTFDWRSKDGLNLLTPVRNQGACGSCWAFATVGVFESAIKIQSGSNVDLSEQYLVSCNNSGYSCNGGWFAHNYHLNQYVSPQTQAGAVLESSFPYTASNSSCSQSFSHPYKLTSWYSIAGDWTVPTVAQIKSAISTYGPVAAAVCVGSGFSQYSGGVFTTDEKASCGGSVNHAILLVGWDDSTSSWILRNSWGTGWGESGYMRIRWGISNVGYAANYVVYQSSSPSTPEPTATPTATAEPATNDNFENAQTITLSNNTFSAREDISGATVAYDDPTLTCANRVGYKTVWFNYTPTIDESISLSTSGSNYDTILGIWQGSRGSLTSVGCNDDENYPTIATSKLSGIAVNAGESYFIEAASYLSITNGTLNLALSTKPQAPSGLTASDGISAAQVELSWEPITGVSSYKIYRSSSETGTKSEIATITDGTAYVDTGSTAGQITYYWVSACLENSCSDFSTTDTGYRLFPALSLTASSGTDTNQVVLKWSSISGAVEYQIYRTDSPTDDPLSSEPLAVITKSDTSIATSYNDTSAAVAQTYSYWISGCTDSVCSVMSDQVSGWRGFAAPMSFSATNNTNSEMIQLTWAESSGVDSYTIWRSTSSTGSKSLIAENITALSYDDTTALPGTSYFYWITASIGDYSSLLSTPVSGLRALAAPQNFNATDGTITSSVSVSWSAVPYATSYRIYRSSSPTGSTTYLGATSGTSYTDKKAVTGLTYYYFVKSCNSITCGLQAGPETGYRGLVPPTIKSASKGTVLTGVQITWKRVAGATSYNVFRTDSPVIDFSGNTLSATPSQVGTNVTGLSFIDTTAVIGQTYYYWVQSCVNTNCGLVRNQVVPGWRGITPPSGVTATYNTSTTGITVNWYASEAATSYTLWRATSSRGKKGVVATNLTSLSFTDTTVIPGKTYYYWVTANIGGLASKHSSYAVGLRSLSAPLGVLATDSASLGTVTVTWQSSNGASLYKIYRASSDAATPVYIGSSKKLSYINKKMPSGVTYYYYVQACAGKICSALSLVDVGSAQ